MSDSIGIDFVPHTYTSTNLTNKFIFLLSTFYAVKLTKRNLRGHSSVVERLVANDTHKKTFFCKSFRFNNTNKLSQNPTSNNQGTV